MRSYINTFIIIAAACFITSSVLAQTLPWERVNPIPFETYVKDCQLLENSRVIAVGSAATILLSDDWGGTWDIQYNPAGIAFDISLKATHFVNNTLGYAVGSHYTILRSENGGHSWVNISQNTGNSSDAYTDVLFLNADTGFIIQNNKELLKTINGSISWDTIIKEDSLDLGKIQFVDHLNGYIKVKTQNGDYFLRTTNGGGNWELAKIEVPVEDFNAGPIHFTTPYIGFVGGSMNNENFIFKTINGGESWYQVYDDNATGISQFNFINKDTGYSMGSVIWYSNNLLRTVDGGESWEIMSDHFGTWFLRSMIMGDNGLGLCLGDNGQVVKITDYGTNWEYLSNMFLYKYNLDDCFILDDSTAIATRGGGGGGVPSYGVIQSDDRGITWYDQENFYGSVSSIDFINDSVGYYCGWDQWQYEKSLMKTTDGGINWQTVELLPIDIEPEKVEFINDEIGFVGGPRYGEYGFSLYKTVDGGLSWIPIENELFDAFDPFKDFEFYNDSSAIIVGGFYPWDDSSQIMVSDDQGINWRWDTLPFQYDFNGVHFINQDTGLLFGYHKICRTIDGGENWYQVPFNHTYALNDDLTFTFVDETVGYLFARATYTNPISEMYKTIDAGETWFEVACPSTSKFNSFGFFSESEGVVVGDKGMIFKTTTGALVKLPEWDSDESPMLTIYPNPAIKVVNIKIPSEYTNGILQIYSLEGRMIFSEECEGQEEINISLEEPDGIYLIRVSNHESAIAGKLISINP
ncbi:MAG: YCF48-related protein [Bacteroidota bacterium]